MSTEMKAILAELRALRQEIGDLKAGRKATPPAARKALSPVELKRREKRAERDKKHQRTLKLIIQNWPGLMQDYTPEEGAERFAELFRDSSDGGTMPDGRKWKAADVLAVVKQRFTAEPWYGAAIPVSTDWPGELHTVLFTRDKAAAEAKVAEKRAEGFDAVLTERFMVPLGEPK